MGNKVVIFSAPSGSGKSTIVHHILSRHPEMEFSISATSRDPRGEEVDGKDYYFISADEFRERILKDEFVEHEEVYPGRFYGTLKKEVQRIWDAGHVIIFDVDVKGGVNLKKYFGNRAIAVFIQAPSIEELRKRLILRATDSAEAIEERIGKAKEEIAFSDRFDHILINDDLETAFREADGLIDKFLSEQ